MNGRPPRSGQINCNIVCAAQLSQTKDMRSLIAFCLMALLAACQPLEIYYAEGAPIGRLQEDQLDCEVRALRDVPVATQIRRTPPVFIPPRQYCDAAGNCYTRGGYWEPGTTYTVDVNASLRERVEQSCMAKRGYRPVSIPPCPASVANAAPPGFTTRLPTLTENSCVIRNRDGSWQIVNRG